MALHHKVIAAATGGQSHLIVAAVLLSFIVWATLQGDLQYFLNDLGIGKKPAAPTLGGATAGGAAGSAVGGGAAQALGQTLGNLPQVLGNLPSLPGQPPN